MTTSSEVPRQLAFGSEHRLRAENLAFDIDVWYPALEKFTFKSVFIPLKRSEAQAIINFYRTRHNLRRTKDCNQEDVDIILNLRKIIKKTLDDKFKNKPAFLRLCGRSPKDGEPLERGFVLKKYEEEYQKLLQQNYPRDANTKLMAISRIGWLRVNSADEAMSLLLTSERVYADMIDWIDFGEPEQIVLREWEPDLSYDYEFRAFICNNKLNAISQYDHYCIYPHLEPLKEKIQQKILEYWKEVHPSVGVPNYVMDFGYLPSSEKVIVIEISPFLPCTGPALFHWVADKERLENGPLEFRLKKKHHVNIKQLVEGHWENEWKKQYSPFTYLIDSIQKKTRKQQNLKLLKFAGLPCGMVAIGYGLLSYLKIVIPHSFMYFVIIFLSFFFGGFAYSLNRKPRKKMTLLFVYGTLKRGFHWNQKFLERSKFVSEAVTQNPYPLVVGQSGVPYLMGDVTDETSKCIKGEVWMVDDETLLGLDEYEGVPKGYYVRNPIGVRYKNSQNIVTAFAYFKSKSTPELTALPKMDEYTLEYHKQNYKAIKHILVKQEMYLGLTDQNT